MHFISQANLHDAEKQITNTMEMEMPGNVNELGKFVLCNWALNALVQPQAFVYLDSWQEQNDDEQLYFDAANSLMIGRSRMPSL